MKQVRECKKKLSRKIHNCCYLRRLFYKGKFKLKIVIVSSKAKEYVLYYQQNILEKSSEEKIPILYTINIMNVNYFLNTKSLKASLRIKWRNVL